MPLATPADAALVSVEARFVTIEDLAVLARHPAAADEIGSTIESFYDTEADAAAALAVIFNFRKEARFDVGVEVNTALNFGTTIPLSPELPVFTVYDVGRGINGPGIVKSFTIDAELDKDAVELFG